jgi:glycine/D-amino acid oxidase-like deaminating enzyme
MTERFGPEMDPALHESSYLILAPDGGEAVWRKTTARRSRRRASAFLDRDALKERALAFDRWDLRRHSRAVRPGLVRCPYAPEALAPARDTGATTIAAEVSAVEQAAGRIVALRLADGRRLGCGILVNAAGTSAGRVAAMAGRPLPVEPRKRSVFVLDAPDAPKHMPLVSDPSGAWARPEGSGFLAGYSPPEENDGPADPADFEVDYAIFEEHLWPAIAARIPAFERLKVMSAWAGHYDYNSLDQNAVIGRDPVLPNLVYANGFSGHGLQHAPGVGRALAELIVHGDFRTIDLSVFDYSRIAEARPLFERNVI